MFRMPRHQRANLQGLIASGRAARADPERYPATPLRIGLEPEEDLLPLPLKGIFVGVPKAMHPFSPLLLLVQTLQSCFRTRSDSLAEKHSRSTIGYGKDEEGSRRGVQNEWEATGGTTKDGLLQQRNLLEEENGIKCL